MKNRLLTIALGLLVVIGGTVCIDSSATAASEPIKFVFSSHTPNKGPGPKAYNDIMNAITDRTQGRIQFESYYMGSLLPSKEVVSGVSKGAADIAFVYSARAARLSLLDVSTLPGIGASYKNQGLNAVEIAKMPEVKAQFDKSKIKLLGVIGGDAAIMWLTKEAKTLDDIKGMKIRAEGPLAKVVSQKYGVVPIAMPGPAMTEAFKKGMLDGTFGEFAGAIPQKHYTLTPWIIDYTFASNLVYLIINKESYERLSGDLKEIFDEEWAKLPQHYIDVYAPFADKVRTKILPENNNTIIHLTDDEKTKFVEACRPVWDEWVAAREKEGYSSAREILNKLLELNNVK